MSIDKEMLDGLLKNAKTSEDLFGENGVLKQLQKALAERMLEAEMSHHLGYVKHEQAKSTGNYRNGKTSKKLITDNLKNPWNDWIEAIRLISH